MQLDGLFGRIQCHIQYVCSRECQNKIKTKKVSRVSLLMFSGGVPAAGVGLQVRHVHAGEETAAGGEVTWPGWGERPQGGVQLPGLTAGQSACVELFQSIFTFTFSVLVYAAIAIALSVVINHRWVKTWFDCSCLQWFYSAVVFECCKWMGCMNLASITT